MLFTFSAAKAETEESVEPGPSGTSKDSSTALPSLEAKHNRFPELADVDDAPLHFRLVDFQHFKFTCPACSSKMTFHEVQRKTMTSQVQLSCDNCDMTCGSAWTAASEDVNNRCVLGLRSAGGGHSMLQSICESLDMPSMSSATFYRSQHEIKERIASDDDWKRTVASAIREAHLGVGNMPGTDGILNISVSYDGTWQKRGYHSHNGVGVVIDVLTGLVLDFEVLSNTCRTCTQMKDKLTCEEFEEWSKGHNLKKQCEKNHEGSAAMMEVRAAEILWQRSIEVFGMRYVTVISDGDSKSFNNLSSLNVYGDEHPIEKEECINHVSKRLLSGLKSFVKEKTSKGIVVSGRNRLTLNKMIYFQGLYRNAIAKSENVEEMNRRINGILFHSMSTKDDHCHRLCDRGESSFCYHQRAIAKGEVPVVPSTHEPLPKDIGMALMPLFKKLSNPELLKRCTKQQTQNANESFNNILWSKCSKSNFCDRSTIEFGAVLAARQYNEGPMATARLMTSVGIEPGLFTLKSINSRIQHAKSAARRKHSVGAKISRKYKKLAKTKAELKAKAAEGKVYGPGKF